jgi:hypothetical protein
MRPSNGDVLEAGDVIIFADSAPLPARKPWRVKHRVPALAAGDLSIGAYTGYGAKFCSWHCSYSYRNTKRKRDKEARSCIVCNGSFVPARNDAKTCSPAYKQRAYRQRRRSFAISAHARG